MSKLTPSQIILFAVGAILLLLAFAAFAAKKWTRAVNDEIGGQVAPAPIS